MADRSWLAVLMALLMVSMVPSTAAFGRASGDVNRLDSQGFTNAYVPARIGRCSLYIAEC